MLVLLFASPSPGKRIAGTPYFDVEFADLSEHRVMLSAANEVLPARYLAQNYAFDVPINPEDLARMRRAGRDLLEARHSGSRARRAWPRKGGAGARPTLRAPPARTGSRRA